MATTSSADERRLREREDELGSLDDALGAVESGGDGRLVLVEGPAGVGKTALVGHLADRTRERGHRVLKAVGSEMERDFGFGVVRQLFGPLLRSLGPAGRAALFTGPVALTAVIFGLANPAEGLDLDPSEGSLYGLFWLLASLAESGPIVLAVDDAHWADAASLRFLRYLANRLDGLPALVVLAFRPNEPGIEATPLVGLAEMPAASAIRPAALSPEATAAVVAEAVGADSAALIGEAVHDATGGNPLLIGSLLAAGNLDPGEGPPPTPDRIARLAPAELGTGVLGRAARLDPSGPDVVRAAAVLGDAADLEATCLLAIVDRGRGAEILDGLAAAAILSPDDRRRFVHPLLRTSIYESIPAARRARMHARAAGFLRERGAEPEAIAAHLLLCEPGAEDGSLGVLEAAARRASERGAPESVAAYLGRALPEARGPEARSEILHRLGRAGVAARDPSSVEHLQEAARVTEDPARALEIYIELADALALAGLWDAAVATIEDALRRLGGSGLPGVFDLEAVRAAARGYDPAAASLYDADLPRLLGLVEEARDERSSQLRWVLAGIGACRDMPREEVVSLVDPGTRRWTFERNGRESSLVAQASFGLVMVGALDEAEAAAGDFAAEARRRGSVLATLCAVGLRAAIDQRRGRLDAAAEGLLGAIDLLRRNELSVMALTTFLHFLQDTIVERPELDDVADLVEGLEVPPTFGRTASGAMLQEVRGAVRQARGDRPGAVTALRAVEELARPLHFGPRFGPWRSRLATALPAEHRDEALALAEEERREGIALGSVEAEGVALRALGLLHGGEQGIASLRRSAELLETAGSDLGSARSLADLGAALRRANRRKEAREVLRSASVLAQRCGATRLEARIQEEMRIAGARPRRRALSGPQSLTPSESRVATAAAGGTTNREIGQTLFISVRTVEMHLTNTYLKLGISGRAELAEALGRSDGAPDPTSTEPT